MTFHLHNFHLTLRPTTPITFAPYQSVKVRTERFFSPFMDLHRPPQFAMHYNNIVIASNFNFSGMQWSDSCPSNDTFCQSLLRRLMVEHHITQTVTQPTRGNAILDLIFVSDTLKIEDISYLVAINRS